MDLWDSGLNFDMWVFPYFLNRVVGRHEGFARLFENARVFATIRYLQRLRVTHHQLDNDDDNWLTRYNLYLGLTAP
jgi:hypothetical protein